MSTPGTDHEDLHALFREVVDGAGPDLDRLTTGSRERGTRIVRRRRLVAVATGSLAVVAVLGVGADLRASEGTDAAPFAGTTATPSPTPEGSVDPSPTPPEPGPAGLPDLVVPTGPRSPITGRSTQAGLVALVTQLADGKASEFGGQGQPPPDGAVETSPSTFAMFTWTPASGGAGTPVMINVQNSFGEIGPTGSGKPFFSCRDGRQRCSVERGDGLVVVSYEDRHGSAVDRHVDVFHPDSQLRVSIASTNASEFEKTDARVRPAPPLSSEVLRAVATSDVWGVTLPRAWESAGERLAQYHDYDAEQP